MISIGDWLPPLVVGMTFTLLGAAKMYGALRGIEGGCDKTFGEKLCGTCPNWKSGYLRFGFPLFFLSIGLCELSQLACVICAASGTP
jgi:hypothetical protein